MSSRRLFRNYFFTLSGIAILASMGSSRSKKSNQSIQNTDKEKMIDFAKYCLNKAYDLDVQTSYRNVEEYYNTFINNSK